MKAIMYGAGNIGRGFIGQLFYEAGYEVTFIDVNKSVTDALNAERGYVVRVISNDGFEDSRVNNVSAINGADTDRVADAIANADIMATAVGVRALDLIAPTVAMGIRRRFMNTDAPLDIIICENLLDANKYLEQKLTALLTEEERALFYGRIGLVEASIGRMVPIQSEEMLKGDPLRVCVEGYKYLPVDGAAFAGAVPPIKTLVPYSPFDYYIKRKLFVHNTGHVICAYLGGFMGEEYIYSSIADPRVRIIAQNAMLESALSLSGLYNIPIKDLAAHIDDLIRRFSNRALKDTCLRVGNDTARKLGRNDRLVGAALSCLSNGVTPVYISAGIAAALYADIGARSLPQSPGAALSLLNEYAGIDETHAIARLVRPLYSVLCKNEPVGNLLCALDRLRADTLIGIV